MSRAAKDLRAAITALKKERGELDRAIATMEETLRTVEKLAKTGGKRGATAALRVRAPVTARPRAWSDDARRAVAERMQRTWPDEAETGKTAPRKHSTKKKATQKKATQKKATQKKATQKKATQKKATTKKATTKKKPAPKKRAARGSKKAPKRRS